MHLIQKWTLVNILETMKCIKAESKPICFNIKQILTTSGKTIVDPGAVSPGVGVVSVLLGGLHPW